MQSADITIFAETNFRNKFRKFGIKADDRRRHMYLIGKTGMGKSTVLENMIVEDIRAGRGVAVVDPHGDLAEKVIEYIPSERINDVIYFNPADLEYPIAFNVVEQVDESMRHIVASGLIGVFKKLWADSWGPRLEYILRNTILAVLDYPGATLLAVIRMLSDKAFRKKVVEKIQDPIVKAFWTKEFASYQDKFASEAVAPIQNKVGQFLSTSLIRNIVGQVKSSFDVREAMDNKKIIILNLSKGRIGEDNSALLGAMMITKIQLAAMSRINQAESEREDFYLYVDEFQNFATESFATILSEARKYRLNLIMAHQYIEQLKDEVKAAVFGNVGTMIVFRIGATDAEELVKEFTPTFMEEDLVNIAKYDMYVRLMIDGIMSEPFSARGLPPLSRDEKTDNLDKVIRVSRERYAKKREAVEEKILKWTMSEDEEPLKPARDFAMPRENRYTDNGRSNSNNSSRENPYYNQRSSAQDRGQDKPLSRKYEEKISLYEQAAPMPRKHSEEKGPGNNANKFPCSRCSQLTELAFTPDGIRPIFCKDCLSLIKKEKRIELEARKQAKEQELKSIAEPPRLVFSDHGNERPRQAKAETAAGSRIRPQDNELSLGMLSNIQPVIFGHNKKRNEEGMNPGTKHPQKREESEADQDEEIERGGKPSISTATRHPASDHVPNTAEEQELDEGQEIYFE